MATIKIEGKEYDLEALSEAARAQLTALRLTDQKLSELQRDLAIVRTARNAYARTLSELLPKEAK